MLKEYAEGDGFFMRLLAVLICLLAGLPCRAEPQRDVYRVGVLYWSMNIPGQVAMRQGLEAEAARLNRLAAEAGQKQLHLDAQVAGDGDEGIERQIQQMMAMIDGGVDIIIVQPTDNAALAEPLRAANRAGIPVVAYDQYIDGGQLAAYRTSDNYQAGVLNGEYIAASFPDDKILNVVMVDYPRVSSTVERANGFLDELTESGQPYQVLRTYEAVEPVGGARAAANLLKDFPRAGSIDVVFTVNDGGGLAVVKALQQAGRTEIAVASIDGDPAAVENIRAGRLTRIDSAQFCGPLGAEAMRAADAILRGEHTPHHALVPVFPVTRETLPHYPGWRGPLPAAFDKPWASRTPRWQPALRVIKP